MGLTVLIVLLAFLLYIVCTGVFVFVSYKVLLFLSKNRNNGDDVELDTNSERRTPLRLFKDGVKRVSTTV